MVIGGVEGVRSVSRLKAFDEHYLACKACTRVPGNLCDEGARLLREANRALAAAMVPIPPIAKPWIKA